MSSVLKVGACLVLATRAHEWASQTEVKAKFVQFVQKFEKSYDGESEEAARFDAFLENLQFIQAENAKGHSYELGLNQFADMTLDEFSKTRLGLRRPANQRWGSLPNLGTHELSNKSLPSSVDWVTKGAVTAVKNQKQCGSCWAFSTTGALEGAWQIATGKLVPLSEQQLVDCPAKKFHEEGCNGGLMDNAFNYAKTVGMCTESSYPYQAKNGICKMKSCTIGIPKGSVVGFKDVTQNSAQALMDAVAQQPVSIAIEADQQVFQLYKSGVMSSPKCGAQLDHGVLLVGYGTDKGKAYWKVKNSWGTVWGEDGYIRLARTVKSEAGECGLESQPSYPVVKGGPSPAPSPPSPPSPPAPPAPSTSHYEKPPCQDDETEARIQGLSGAMCAPKCKSGSCPSDVPAGTTAKPTCALQSPTGGKYCALMCSSDSECPSGATCGKISFVGICVYSSSMPPATSLQVQSSLEDLLV